MKNLLRVIASMDPISGGPSQGIRNSIAELRKYNINSEVVSLDEPSSFSGKDSFTIHALGHKGPWQYSSKLITWLMSNICRFDVIIVDGLWLYHGYAINKVMRKLNKMNSSSQKIPKIYVMPHGMLDPYFQKASNRKIKALRNWIYWKIFESRNINNAEGILFTCETEMVLARQTFQPYKPNKELNIGYGIDRPPVINSEMLNSFFRKCPNVKNTPYILFLSRIHFKKGVDLLIMAYQNLLERKRGNFLPKLVIAGPGLETPYGKLIRNIVYRSSFLNDFVFFTGMLSGDEKWGAFYACEAFVLPSHQENFGIAVVEALACSKPVLISNKVNIYKEVEAGRAGIIGEDTIEGTMKILQEWITKPLEEKTIISENAFNTYLKYFSIDRSTKQLVETLF